MKDKKIKSTAHLSSLTGLRFIFLSLFIILLMDAFTIGIHAWETMAAMTASSKSASSQLVAEKSQEINGVFTSDESLLTYLSEGKTMPPDIYQTFDVGIAVKQNGKIVNTNFTQKGTLAFPSFLSQLTASTPQVVVDATNKVAFITNYTSASQFSIGAINLEGIMMQKLLTTPLHTYYLLSNSTLLESDAKVADTNFIDSLHIHPQSINQIVLGNIHKEIFTFSPIGSSTLGFALLDETFYPEIESDVIQFAVYATLAFAAMFLTISFIFSMLMEIPLLHLVNFLEAIQNGSITKIPNSNDGSFKLLYNQLNVFISTMQQEKLRAVQSDKLQKDFILLSGHILRTPLASMVGYLDLLKEINRDEKLNPYIANIETNLHKLSEVEENLVALSQEDTKLLNSVREKIIIKDILKMSFTNFQLVAAKKNLTYKLMVDDLQKEAIYADTHALGHAIDNLLDNAIKFTPENGTVKLYTKKILNDIIICVSDTGIGLQAEEKELLFKKFSRISSSLEYNSDGLGIGLYVASQIVANFGGEIWVDSIKGSGSIFNIKLPLAQ